MLNGKVFTNPDIVKKEKMMTVKENSSLTNFVESSFKILPRTAAILAGVGFLMSFVGAIFASLKVDTEALATDPNAILIGVFGFLIAILGDIVRAWAFYVCFKPINKSLAVASAWFMLIHDAIFGAALINLILGFVLFSGADYLAVFEPGQLKALSLLFSEVYVYGFQIGLFFFSFHLGILGYLVSRSGYIPKILSVLLYIASFGYLVNSVGIIISPGFPEIFWTVFMVPCLLGELAIVIWLAVKGGRETIS
jgi:Domain of unknown function (DUF4386)